MSFIETFNQQYAPLLEKRADTFRDMFVYLDSMNKSFYTIVETGTTRVIDNFFGDGCSTLLFDKYINSKWNGVIHTVDIDADSCKVARSITSDKTIVTISDSVVFLSKFPKPEEIDLLYLDSYDFDFNNPHPSSLHHLKELAAIYPKLRSGCLIVVDDNFDNNVGKGTYVRDFLSNVGDKLVFDKYHMGFIKK